MEGNRTREHVIPDCFFADPRPSNLLTYPAHLTCNSQYKVSDEYARNILAWLGIEKSATARKLWDGKVERSIRGNRELRTHLVSALIPKAEKFSAGGVYLGAFPGIRFDRKRMYPTLEKIVRGLHRLSAGSAMPHDARFRWFIQEPLHGDRQKLFEQSRASISYGDVFESRFVTASEDSGATIAGAIWWLRFYQATPIETLVRFSAIHPPPPR
jgi:hypothetical protein